MLYACCTHSCCLTALIMYICSTCAAGVMLLSSMYAAYRKIETAPHMCHICAYEGCMCAQKSMPHVCILLYAIHAQWHVCHSWVVYPSTCMLHACGAFQFLCMWHTTTAWPQGQMCAVLPLQMCSLPLLLWPQDQMCVLLLLLRPQDQVCTTTTAWPQDQMCALLLLHRP